MVDLYKRYRVEIELIERILGSQPTNPKARRFLELREDEEVPTSTEVFKMTFFRKDGRPVLMDYEIKGYLKEAASILPQFLGIPGRRREVPSPTFVKGQLDRWLFVSPRHVPFIGPDGRIKEDVDGSIIHFLRAMTRQGPRVTPLESDFIEAGARLAFTISVIEHCPISEEALRAWLAYAEEGMGLLVWRTAGYGRFRVIGFAPVQREQAQ